MPEPAAEEGRAFRARICRNPVYLAAFGFGSGLAPLAPGTFGTLVGVPVFWAISAWSLPAYLLATLALTLLGVWLCGHTARGLGVHDHPGIVWDEIVGYLVTMTTLPADWTWMLAGFVAFRFFDIVKPWPIQAIDSHLEGGLGIMLDDLLAGFYAAAILQAAALTLA